MRSGAFYDSREGALVDNLFDEVGAPFAGGHARLHHPPMWASHALITVAVRTDQFFWYATARRPAASQSASAWVKETAARLATNLIGHVSRMIPLSTSVKKAVMEYLALALNVAVHNRSWQRRCQCGLRCTTPNRRACPVCRFVYVAV